VGERLSIVRVFQTRHLIVSLGLRRVLEPFRSREAAVLAGGSMLGIGACAARMFRRPASVPCGRIRPPDAGRVQLQRVQGVSAKIVSLFFGSYHRCVGEVRRRVVELGVLPIVRVTPIAGPGHASPHNFATPLSFAPVSSTFCGNLWVIAASISVSNPSPEPLRTPFDPHLRTPLSDLSGAGGVRRTLESAVEA